MDVKIAVLVHFGILLVNVIEKVESLTTFGCYFSICASRSSAAFIGIVAQDIGCIGRLELRISNFAKCAE